MNEKLKLLWAYIMAFANDQKAAVGVSDVIIMAVSFLLVAVLGPIAIGEIFNATTTGWSAAVKTIFQVLLPIIWIVSVAVKYLPREG